jgi:hypothetical protein
MLSIGPVPSNVFQLHGFVGDAGTPPFFAIVEEGIANSILFLGQPGSAK